MLNTWDPERTDMVKKAVNEGKNPADQPTGFVQTFKSRFVNVDGLHQHAVIDGGGPPLLLLGGWPQIWPLLLRTTAQLKEPACSKEM